MEAVILGAAALMNINPAGAVDVLMWWGHLFLAHCILRNQQPHPLACWGHSRHRAVCGMHV